MLTARFADIQRFRYRLMMISLDAGFEDMAVACLARVAEPTLWILAFDRTLDGPKGHASG